MSQMKKRLVSEIYLIEGDIFIALERSSFPQPELFVIYMYRFFVILDHFVILIFQEKSFLYAMSRDFHPTLY